MRSSVANLTWRKFSHRHLINDVVKDLLGRSRAGKALTATKGMILVVDDEPLIVDELVDTLELEGFRTDTAYCASEALGRLKVNREIALVITDLRMPGKTGWDLIDDALSLGFDDLKFLVVSGHETVDNTLAGVPMQVVGFLRKPVDVEELLRSVDAYACAREM